MNFFSCSFDTFSYQRDILKALNKFLRETELEKGAISLFWTSKILLHRHLPLHHQLLLSSFFSTPSPFLMKSSVPENRLVLASQFFFHDKHFSLSFDIWTAGKRPPCETKQIVEYVLHSRHFRNGSLAQWIWSFHCVFMLPSEWGWHSQLQRRLLLFFCWLVQCFSCITPLNKKLWLTVLVLKSPRPDDSGVYAVCVLKC